MSKSVEVYTLFTQAQPVQLVARPFKHKVMLHHQLLEELKAGVEFYCKRATLVISQLVINPDGVDIKGTTGVNKGWRRTRLGGNGGSHYYLWWTTSGSAPAKGIAPKSEELVYYVRCTRHHDDTDQALKFGNIDHYQAIADRLALEELPSPWTPDQLTFIKAYSDPVRLLKGTPGTGKTTSLWRAVDEALDARVLYLTWSKDLATNASAHFTQMTSKQTQVDAQHLTAFLQRFQQTADEGDAPRQSVAKQRETFATHLPKIRDYKLRAEVEAEVELYFGLVRAWVVGRAPWDMTRAVEGLQSRAELAKRAQERGTEEVKARFTALIRELKEEGAERDDDEVAVQVSRNESVAEAEQEESLLRSWDQVIREPLKTAKKIYKAMKLTEAEEAELFPELVLARDALAQLRDPNYLSRGALRELFPYQKIVIDEVQDLTPLELEVVIALCQPQAAVSRLITDRLTKIERCLNPLDTQLSSHNALGLSEGQSPELHMEVDLAGSA